MTGKEIMVFHVSIDREERTEMVKKDGKVVFIPFGGEVNSELFCGKIRPGAADVQVTNAAGIRHMCAKYIFEGKDYTGAECKLYVENNGFFEPGNQPRPFHACPIFMTDSEALAEYLERPHFRAEGWGRPDGVDIHIIDIEKED